MAKRFDLEDLNPSVKFLFDDIDPDGGSVTLRVCSGAALDEIRAKTVKTRVEYKRGGRFEVTETDDKAMSQGIWDYSITDWDIEDAKGTPVPCTAANKAKLMSESPAFSKRISAFLSRLQEDLEADAEAVEKN